ncbi:DUF2341 domain-containing protein, partial [candidate division WWE3 bacterium]|nr:DUF2341 domain-containing protein [candidate division WWE3 bacterium]
MKKLLPITKRITLPEWEFDIVVAVLLFVGLVAGSMLTLSGGFPQIFADSPTSITLTTDTSYSQGTLTNTEVSGTGTSGSIQLAGSAGPDNTLYRKKLTFDNSGQSENLTNFPVLVTLSSSNFDFSKVQNDGDDIRFTDSDGSTLLDYDIESFDSNTEEAYIWVNIPQIDQSSDTDHIYMYYGNDSLTSAENPTGIWDEDYSMVYHLNESSGTTGVDSVIDSTGNTTGTPSSGISFGETGRIGSSADFSSGTGISLGSLGAPLLTDDVTISFWMNVNNYTSPSRQNPFEQAYGGWGTMTLETNSRISWFFGSNGANASPYGSHQSNNIAENGNWVYVTAVRDGTSNTYSWYKNGTYLSEGSFSTSYPNIQSRPFTIGDGYVNPLNGKIDEFRVAKQARSSDWVAASYLSDTDTFISYGSEETTIQTVGSWSSPTNSNAINLIWNSGWGDGSTGSSIAFSADVSNVSASSTITFKIRTASSPSQLNSATFQTIGVATSGTTFTATKDDLDSLGIPIEGLGTYAQIHAEFSQSNGLNPTINSFTLYYSGDDTGPESNATLVSMKSSNDGNSINENDWVSSHQPYFSWTGGADSQAGLKGYCLYLGTDAAGDPATSKGLLGTSPISLTGSTCGFIINATNIDFTTTSYKGSPWLISSTNSYYFKIKAIDNANNVSTTAESFTFKFDNTPPTNPSGLSAPQGFLRNIESFTIAWPTTGDAAALDAHSQIKGYQYMIGSSGSWHGSNHLGTGECNDILTTSPYVLDTDYDTLQTGDNTLYFRTIDTACNVSATSVTAILKYNADAPSSPQDLTVTPITNTSNSFAFSWQKPDQFQGNESGISYCYTVNALPTQTNCTFTSNTTLSADAYATQPGENIFYVVAKDEAGNINYGDFISVKFTANTPAPGIARNVDVADISVKTTENWRLAIAWDEPSNIGAGITKYDVYRSTTESSCSSVFGAFNLIGSTAGLTYSDSGLVQQDYYYCVKACDSANNCSAVSSTATGFPDGKYTEPAEIISNPTATSITT